MKHDHPFQFTNRTSSADPDGQGAMSRQIFTKILSLIADC